MHTQRREGYTMILPDLYIPLIEGSLWLVQGIVYFEDKKGRQKKLGKIDLGEVEHEF